MHTTSIFIVAALALFSGAAAAPENSTAPRIGLLASSLGVSAVPGYSDVESAPPVLEYNSGPPPQQVPVLAPQYGNDHSDGGHVQHPPPSSGCSCVPIEQCPQPGGGGGGAPIPEKDIPGGGYGGGGDGGGGDAPYDGAGLIDVRIVNRPPKAGGVVCLSGQTFCCAPQPQQPFPGGGYAKCGARQILEVPGYGRQHGEAAFGAYPWMAVLLGKGNNYLGAGALISDSHVLTAAHKVKNWKAGSFLKVRLGEWNAKDDSEPYKNVEIEVANIAIHPQFNPDNLFNDVALVTLAHPVDLTAFPHIRSVCLPQVPSEKFIGKRCWVGGFGKDAFGNGKHSFVMKEVDVPVVAAGTCENSLRGTRLGRSFYLNKQSFLCAGGEEGKDACTGDGGSPLVCQAEDGLWTVVGLVAWGIGCADYNVPGVYVNVPNYLEWIDLAMHGGGGGGGGGGAYGGSAPPAPPQNLPPLKAPAY